MHFQWHNMKKKCHVSGLAWVASERQALNGSPAPLNSCCLTSCQAPAKKKWNPVAVDHPVSVSAGNACNVNRM